MIKENQELMKPNVLGVMASGISNHLQEWVYGQGTWTGYIMEGSSCGQVYGTSNYVKRADIATNSNGDYPYIDEMRWTAKIYKPSGCHTYGRINIVFKDENGNSVGGTETGNFWTNQDYSDGINNNFGVKNFTSSNLTQSAPVAEWGTTTWSQASYFQMYSTQYDGYWS